MCFTLLKKNFLMLVLVPLIMLALPVAATTMAIDRADASVSSTNPDGDLAAAAPADDDLLSVAVSLWGLTGIAGVGGMIAFGVAVSSAGRRGRAQSSSPGQTDTQPSLA